MGDNVGTMSAATAATGAIACLDSLLSPARWAQIMGVNPYYFMGAYTSVWDRSGDCDPLWLQYAWMDADKVGREDLSRAIMQAEADMARELGYWPAPVWISAEDHEYPRHFDKALFGLYGLNQRWQRKSIRATWGYVRAVGQEAKSLIHATAAVAISGDNATVSVATTVTEPNEINVYARTVDGADAAASDRYQIRPVKITISSGVATIRGHKAQFIKPSLWEAAAEIDGDAAASYCAAVDVYRHYTDPSDPADFYWENWPEGCTDTDASGCAYGTQTACLLMRNPQLGFLVPTPATYDAATNAFTEAGFADNRDPDKVRLYYRAGYPLCNGEMDDTMARAVAYYACALLGREGCDCGYLGRFIHRWQEDLAIDLETKSYQNGQHVLDNPFGTERGAVFAWQRVKQGKLGEGFAL